MTSCQFYNNKNKAVLCGHYLPSNNLMMKTRVFVVSLKFKEDKRIIVLVCAGPSHASRCGAGWDVGAVHLLDGS